MAKTNDDLLGRPLYVYDLPSQVLDSLTLKTDVSADSEVVHPSDTEINDRPSSPGAESNASLDTAVGSQACSLCGLSFVTVLDQRGHLKSDLHHYNLKQKLRGKKPVTEQEFEKLVEHLDESLSGSDDDDSDEDDHDGRQDTTLTALLRKQARLGDKAKIDDDDEEDETKPKPKPAKEPLLWFSSPLLPENRYFGMYRALFTGEQQRNPDVVEELKKKQLQPLTIPKPGADGKLVEAAYTGPHIFLCMIGGGHFAAMVVALPPRSSKHGNMPMNREATVLAHKTFHRYTTRRKQGGSQSANDNSKGAAHSAGSTLRRYNEQALVDDIRALLQGWKALIDTSELLFVRATGMTNRRTLYGPYDGQVLKHNDTRLRAFPFTTKRATQNELMRSFIELTRLKVREIIPKQESKPGSGAQTPSKPTSQKPVKPKLSEEEQNALLHTSQIQALTRRSKLPALLSYLKSNDVAVDFEFVPIEPNHHAPRPLHFAASQNSAPLVSGLLIKAGANPTLKNADGKTPFELAGDRATRDAFRVARSELGEAKWDWDAAKVPPAMTKTEADRRDKSEKQDADKKESERRKAEEERLRKEGPQVQDKKPGRGQMLAAASVKTAQERREEEARGLTPEMKMRLERERRARAAEERIKRMQGGT